MPCVYFIRKANRDIYKIGMTGSYAESRLKSLQTGSEEALTLCASIRCKSTHIATEIERELHSAFARQRLHGEWFNMTLADMESILRAYECKGHKTERHKVTVDRTLPRFIGGSDKRMKDTDGAALRRALTRVAAVEQANHELTGKRIDQISRLRGMVEARDKEIARLKRELERARARRSWRYRLRQVWGFFTLNPPKR
jgi:hypothetical protein